MHCRARSARPPSLPPQKCRFKPVFWRREAAYGYLHRGRQRRWITEQQAVKFSQRGTGSPNDSHSPHLPFGASTPFTTAACTKSSSAKALHRTRYDSFQQTTAARRHLGGGGSSRTCCRMMRWHPTPVPPMQQRSMSASSRAQWRRWEATQRRSPPVDRCHRSSRCESAQCGHRCAGKGNTDLHLCETSVRPASAHSALAAESVRTAALCIVCMYKSAVLHQQPGKTAKLDTCCARKAMQEMHQTAAAAQSHQAAG
jgi:hypothetical protein